MVNKVAVISINVKTSISIMDEILEILSYDVIIKPYSIFEEISDLNSYGLIVFSSHFSCEFCLERYGISSKYMVLNRIIDLNNIKPILEISHGETVLVVSSHEFNCMEIINQLKSYGMDHIEYRPYYDFIKSYESLHTAITADEEEIVPRCVDKLINIGCRRIDISSMVEILFHLDLINKYKDKLNLYFYKKAFVSPASKLIESFKDIKMKNVFLEELLDKLQLGVVSVDDEEIVSFVNKYAADILNSKDNIFVEVGKKINRSKLKTPDFIVSSNSIKEANGKNQELIIFESAETIKGKDESVRIKKKYFVNIAKYKFDDIKSISPKQNQVVQMAKKMAITSSTILIQGESGTGKELLAQSIHNYSNRAKFPFVAVNFSAIPENLLESELFGYEGGSFTGAKRDGKEGLLRKAQNGTLFLDEIGDLPFNLQVKLLRVIQEREIIPIGGTSPIPIDVRIISATNKNLAVEVKNKRFREDLFYRLNVLPIYTIPLRERTEDILYMIDFFIKSLSDYYGWQEVFTEDVAKFLIVYEWPGNVRELENCIEYFLSIKNIDEIIDMSQIPIYMFSRSHLQSCSVSGDFKLWIVKKLFDHKGIGRNGLRELAKLEMPQLTEGRIRAIMNELKDENLISMKKGINGTELTEKGITFLRNLYNAE